MTTPFNKMNATNIRPCSCGKPRTKEWHLACETCWNLIPKELQDEVYHQFKINRGGPDHIAAVRKCYEALREGRSVTACNLPVVETLNKLPEVTWDRFAGDGLENVSVYGWVQRDDGRSDYVLIMIDKGGPWLISTSSAKFSADFSARLNMDSDGHTGCRRVEDHFPGVRCVTTEARP